MALYYNQLTNADPARMEQHFESHLSTHWANMSNFINILTASPEKSKLLLQGAIQRYNQQNGDLSLVDIFGMLMGGTLLTKKPPAMKEPQDQQEMEQRMREDDTMEDMDTKRAMHLTGQAEFLKDGSEPLPIYCVVRHDIAYGKTFEERIKELKKMTFKTSQEKKELDTLETKADKFEDEQPSDAYQWFEFTPYDMGCEEIEGSVYCDKVLKDSRLLTLAWFHTSLDPHVGIWKTVWKGQKHRETARANAGYIDGVTYLIEEKGIVIQ